MGSDGRYVYTHPRPAVTVDIVCFRRRAKGWDIALIQRGRQPFAGMWALPGGFVEIDEDLPDAARRELAEETGLTPRFIDQFRCFGTPGRDPRGRTISVTYLAIIGRGQTGRAGDDAAGIEWFDETNLPALAFDHAIIINKACDVRDRWIDDGLIKDTDVQ